MNPIVCHRQQQHNVEAKFPTKVTHKVKMEEEKDKWAEPNEMESSKHV